jgi:hypothetical protein
MFLLVKPQWMKVRLRSVRRLPSRRAKNIHSHGDAVPSASDAENRAPELILSAAAEEKQSWIGANKYVIVVLLIMAGAIAAVFFLR